MATYRGKKLTPIEDAALEVLVNKLAPNPEDYRVDDEVNEAVHPMGVHVTSVPGKKVEGLPAYKVTKVGSKVKEHGGIKVGEHLHDNHIDDLADMGHKIKTEETTTKKEETMKDEDNQKTLANYAADTISNTVGEGAFKSMVTDKMTTGKGMSYNKAMKAAQKDLDKGKNIPKTRLNPVKEDNKKTLADYAADAISKSVGEELSAAQKKLPPGLQKAIMKKKGKSVTEDMHKKKKKHDCASKVKSEEYGVGHCMPEQHTMLEDGTVTHYDVLFDHGLVENVPVTELEILQESMHEHYDNEEKNDQIEEGALGTGIGAVGGAALGGPVGAAVGGLAGHMAQQGLRKLGKKIKAGVQGFRKPQTAEELEYVDETVEYHNYYDIKIAEEYTYEDFVKAAIAVTDGSDDAIQIAEDYFYNNDLSLIIEEFTRSDIEDKIKVHKKAGSSVTMPKYSMKDDKMHAEFTVTDKKGMRRRHIHHGNISKLENMGKVNVSPDKD